MKHTHLLALTTAALLAAGSAFAGPNCKKNCPKDSAPSEEGVYEVIERDGDAKGEARDGKEKRERGERGDRERRGAFHGLELTDEQKESVQEIMSAAREEAKAIMEEAKASKEAGEEVDRESVREQVMAIRKAAMQDVYDNVLNDDQRAKVDERRAKMEERRAQREAEGKDGERPERKRRGEKKGGDEELDL